MDEAPTGTGPDGEPGLLDQVQQRLDSLAELALEQRPDAFQDIHDHLRSALAEIDDA